MILFFESVAADKKHRVLLKIVEFLLFIFLRKQGAGIPVLKITLSHIHKCVFLCDSPQFIWHSRTFRNGGWVNTMIPKCSAAGFQPLSVFRRENRNNVYGCAEFENASENNSSNTYDFVLLCKTYLFHSDKCFPTIQEKISKCSNIQNCRNLRVKSF